MLHPKVTRPRLPQVLLRARLFDRLDRARSHPLVWVSGPPGAGKTTLVASYLAARRRRALWYQLDAGDADPATLFYYLRLAAVARRSRRGRPLPLLTPEYLADLATFTRRFFEEMYHRLPRPALLVLDDYHEVPADSAVHAVIRDGLAALPAGCGAIIASRGEPPPALARLRANRAMEILGWDELRLTAEEAHDLVHLLAPRRAPAETIETLHARAGGWPAGLVLLLERLRLAEARAASDGGAPAQALFEYFAGEIFEQAAPETRRFLLETAYLPTMTARMAERLTGLPRAGRLLADLNRTHYFTTRRGDDEAVYEYHPLFRDFLLARAKATFAPERLREVQRAAAALLDAADRVEDALDLLHDAGDFAALGAIVHRLAPGLLAQGRHRTLETWLGKLPAGALDANPWLRYWLGASLLPVDPAGARREFERAFARFEDAADRTGQLLASAGAIDAIFYEWSEFTGMDPWIARIEGALRDGPGPLPPAVETRAACSLLTALVWRQPDHPRFDAWAARAEALSQATGDLSLRMTTGYTLVLYNLWKGRWNRAAVVAASLRDSFRSQAASPLARLLGLAIEAAQAWATADVRTCVRAVVDALDLARTSGVHAVDALLLSQGTYGALFAGDLDTAGRFVEQIAARVAAAPLRMQVALYHYAAGWDALARGDLPRAVTHAETSLALVAATGAPFSIALHRLAAAEVRIDLGDHGAASAHIADARDIATRIGSRVLEYMCLLAEARSALDGGDEAAGLAALGAALALGREHGILTTPWWRPGIMARLCAKALEAGIEVEYVQSVVRRLRLVPESPPLLVERWPWPVEVFTLGRFEVRRDGRPLPLPGRAGRMPVALLKAIAAGGRRGVLASQLAETLWPDADGESAEVALATTLYRLRRLLGCDEAVQRREGRVSLDPRLCWVDALAVERLLDRIESVRHGGAAGAEAREVERNLARVVRLYEGAFLEGEERDPRVIATRERLRARLLAEIGRLGRHLEQAGGPDAALDWYRKGIDVDPCAEEIYQRLMAGLARLGRRAEALAVYRRCREALAARLAIEPSPATEALHQALRGET